VLVLGATRLRSSTSAILAGEIRIHAASTDRVDVAASWQEWVDEPRPGGDDAPSRRERTAVALTRQVHLRRDVASEPPVGDWAHAARFTEADDLLVLGVGPRSGGVPEFLSAHELYDTKHRRIAYRADGVLPGASGAGPPGHPVGVRSGLVGRAAAARAAALHPQGGRR
jgi:hypothetical protein